MYPSGTYLLHPALAQFSSSQSSGPSGRELRFAATSMIRCVRQANPVDLYDDKLPAPSCDAIPTAEALHKPPGPEFVCFNRHDGGIKPEDWPEWMRRFKDY